MSISFLDCPHNNVQEFSDWCLDCGYNIYTTEEQYLADLKEKNRKNEIRKLEKQLGIEGRDDSDF